MGDAAREARETREARGEAEGLRQTRATVSALWCDISSSSGAVASFPKVPIVSPGLKFFSSVSCDLCADWIANCYPHRNE